METTTVDVRRLQILNDRINQMLEAFQLMRLSMHAPGYVPDERAIFGGVTPFSGYVPYGTTPFGYAPYGQPQYVQGNLPNGSYPYNMATPIPPWGAPVWARPYESNVMPRFIDTRFAPNGQQIPQNGPFPFPVNGQLPVSANGQLSFSPTAAFG